MKITGKHTLAVPRDVVWEAILDPEVLSRTLPGCEDMAPVGENQFRGKLKMKVGPVQGLFEGGVELLDLDPPNGYNLKMDGKGAPGFVNGTGSIRLEDADGDGTPAPLRHRRPGRRPHRRGRPAAARQFGPRC